MRTEFDPCGELSAKLHIQCPCEAGLRSYQRTMPGNQSSSDNHLSTLLFCPSQCGEQFRTEDKGWKEKDQKSERRHVRLILYYSKSRGKSTILKDLGFYSELELQSLLSRYPPPRRKYGQPQKAEIHSKGFE
jgi:hypothetical protein